MRRKYGPADITYCSTPCIDLECKRNLRVYKSPDEQYSCLYFNSECKDELHLGCKYKLL